MIKNATGNSYRIHGTKQDSLSALAFRRNISHAVEHLRWDIETTMSHEIVGPEENGLKVNDNADGCAQESLGHSICMRTM